MNEEYANGFGFDDGIRNKSWGIANGNGKSRGNNYGNISGTDMDVYDYNGVTTYAKNSKALAHLTPLSSNPG